MFTKRNSTKENPMEKKIFKKQLALELRGKGFEIIRTEPNYYKPEFDVYIFKNTDALNVTLADISLNKRII